MEEKRDIENLKSEVSSHPYFEIVDEKRGKVRCKLTNHEFPLKREDFENYLISKSYLKGLENDFDFGRYEEFITNHKRMKKFLFCKITKKMMPRKRSCFVKHVNGKNFRKHLRKMEKLKQKKGSKIWKKMRYFGQRVNEMRDETGFGEKEAKMKRVFLAKFLKLSKNFNEEVSGIGITRRLFNKVN